MGSLVGLSRNFILGSVFTAANAGSGVGVFKSREGAELRFKSIVAGSGMSVSDDGEGDVLVHGVEAVNLIRVQKNPAPGRFTSVKSAIDSIAGNSSSNRFVVKVGPGNYSEDPITMKPFVAVIGEGIEETRISASDPADHLFTMADLSAIKSCFLTGASGVSKAAVFYSSSNSPTMATCFVEEVRFGNNYHHVLCRAPGAGAGCTVVVHNAKYGGNFPYTQGFVATNSGSGIARVQVRSSAQVARQGSPLPADFALVDGPGCEMVLNGVQARVATSPLGGNFLRVRDGGVARVSAANAVGFQKAIFVENVGDPPQISVDSFRPESCGMDVVIEHPMASGQFSGVADRSKVSIDENAPVSVFFTHAGDVPGLSLIGDIFVGHNSDAVTNVTDLIQRTTPVGAIEGGELSLGSGPLDIDVAAGNGYCENTVIVKNRKVEWSATTLTLPDNSNIFIYVTADGTVTQAASQPNVQETILLGRVKTLDGDVHYISKIPIQSEHHSTNLDAFAREAFGAVYVAGSVVSENPASGLHIDVSPGAYFFSSLKFAPAGGVDLEFHQHFHSGASFSHGPHTKVVDNARWDSGSGLSPLSPGFFTKHSMYVIGQGADEQYMLVFGQSQHDNLPDVQAGALPTPPSDFTDSVAPIAAIVVQQGSGNVVEVQDIRPRLAFTAVSISAGSDHGNLTGLLDDDHPQYLLVNGTRAMTGNIDMDGNSIVDVNLVDGVDVSDHSSRHEPNGSDSLPIGSPVSVGTSNDPGNSNDFSRGNHVHAHGNQAGGSLHAVATSGSAGFMSGPDKYKLDNDLHVFKTANESLSSNTTLQNDDHLLTSLPANSSWYFELVLFLSAGATAADWKIGWSVPLGTTMLWGPHSAGGQANWDMAGTGAAPDALLTEASVLSFGSAANTHGAFVRGLITVGPTAGSVVLQWAQNSSNAAANTVLAGSYLRLRRVV